MTSRLAHLCSSRLLWKARKVKGRTEDQEKVNALKKGKVSDTGKMA